MQNSLYDEIVDATASSAGCLATISLPVSTVMPIKAVVVAMLPNVPPENGLVFKLACFNLVSLNMALGLSLEIYPRYCQVIPPSGDGHPK